MYESILIHSEPHQALRGVGWPHTPSQECVIKGIRMVSKRAYLPESARWGRTPEMRDLGINRPFTGIQDTCIWPILHTLCEDLLQDGVAPKGPPALGRTQSTPTCSSQCPQYHAHKVPKWHVTPISRVPSTTGVLVYHLEALPGVAVSRSCSTSCTHHGPS